MTIYLCDTHALLWWVRAPTKLGITAREVLRDATTDVRVSAVVPWELSIKHQLGKLPEALPIITAYPQTLRALGVTSLPITDEHALLAGELSWEHRDPFDRMLAAQTILEGAVLLSADRVFDSMPGVSRAW